MERVDSFVCSTSDSSTLADARILLYLPIPCESIKLGPHSKKCLGQKEVSHWTPAAPEFSKCELGEDISLRGNPILAETGTRIVRDSNRTHASLNHTSLSNPETYASMDIDDLRAYSSSAASRRTATLLLPLSQLCTSQAVLLTKGILQGQWKLVKEMSGVVHTH